MFEFFPGNYRWSYNTLLAVAAGGQLGDVALIHPQLREKLGDDAAWHEQWAWLAGVLEKRAKAGSRHAAAENYFLSSLYHTISEHFIPPADPARLASYREVLRTFDLGREHSSHPVERVAVPFEGSSLPAYFVPAANALGKGGPAAIFICGLDTTKELWFLRARLQFAARGISALFIDTPGIGEALRLQKLVTRHDYEKPVGAALGWLEKRADPARIGIVGSSLGGYYVARAAAFEPRLKAAVAWGAIYDYHRVWVRRMQGKGIVAAPRFQLMFITGTDSMEAAVDKVKDFRVADFAARIRCPFLVMHGAEDQQVLMEDAEAMYAAIGSPDKEMAVFTGENGGAAHTQFDNHLPALQVCADWVARKL